MRRNITYIFNHCTASPQTQRVSEILSYWKNKLGWGEIPGYHHLIEANGKDNYIWDISAPSNGVAGYNKNAIHISYIGGVVPETKTVAGVEQIKGHPIDNRTQAQKDTQLSLLYKYNKLYPEAVILGHRDISPDKNRNGIVEPSEWVKACPSYSVKEWLKEVEFKSALAFKLYHTTANVNIREGAGVNFKTVTDILPKGTKIKKLAEADGWVYCELYQTNITGWIKDDFLT